MADRVIDRLAIRPDGVYVDCTAGAGGHSALIAEKLTTGRLIAIDRDEDAVAIAADRLKAYPQADVVHGNYGELAALLDARGVGQIDGVIIDAGVSSMQLDRADRGFSLQAEGPLDMRMDRGEALDASRFISECKTEDLAEVLKKYGDVKKPKRIAQAIINRRNSNQLHTTLDLCNAVAEALGVRGKVPQEAYAVFQAIRIQVNEELRWLNLGLEQAVKRLAPGGRIVAISFHSGEDRVVKNLLKKYAKKKKMLTEDGRVASERPPLIDLVSKKPELPDEAEIKANPRARSAKLRAAVRRAEEAAHA